MANSNSSGITSQAPQRANNVPAGNGEQRDGFGFKVSTQETGIIVAVCAIIVTVIGWKVIHRQNLRRDRQNRLESKRDAGEVKMSAAQDSFRSAVTQWIGNINEARSNLPEIHRRSLPAIRQAVDDFIPKLNGDARPRFEAAWKNYQGAHDLAGVQKSGGIGAGMIADYTDARKALTEPLEEMLDAASKAT